MVKRGWVRGVVAAVVGVGLAGWMGGHSGAQAVAPKKAAGEFVGMDRNAYPGDPALDTIAKHFSFVGYWLSNPPEEKTNTWVGKRAVIAAHNLGFLVLWNGRLDQEIAAKAKRGRPAAALGAADAQAAVQAAKREGFPAGTVIFLDQEEGGRLMQEQADYLFGWTEGVYAGGFRAGAYVSGEPVPDGPGKTITTAQNIEEIVEAKHLNPVALFVFQDNAPPANGCTLTPPAMGTSGTPGAVVWQYALSPRTNAKASRKGYAKDGNCYVAELPGVHLDLDVAKESDPSHGR